MVVSIPSGDLAFAAAVRRVAQELDVPAPAALEAGLRILYPSAVVRTRELSGEPNVTLYAYRDRSFVRDREDDWTLGDNVAWAAFDPRTGQIVEANEALSSLFRVGGSMVGRFAREFVPEGADGISDAQLAAIAAAGSARSAGMARRGDGSPLFVEFVARVVGARLEAWYREAEAKE